jgi:hypothetical protein
MSSQAPIKVAAHLLRLDGALEEDYYIALPDVEAAVKASGRGLDSSVSCFDGVAYQTCEVAPGLAVAVAGEGEGPVIIDLQSRGVSVVI